MLLPYAQGMVHAEQMAVVLAILVGQEVLVIPVSHARKLK
jgi:hypothetical protein